jgi:phosphatidylserine/phosphatidylglycerophosphate/cardiolipin synthase-like enzyme
VNTEVTFRNHPAPRHRLALTTIVGLLVAYSALPASAQVERMYFPAVDNVRQVLVQRINAETVRIDMSAWYLTDGEVVNALLAKHQQGVPIRLLGDRGSIFEIDVHTRNAFYRLANAGVPIRLRVNPTWYPEIDHWKATIFVGQNVLTFGSANYTPFELAPHSATNYKDETVLFTDDPQLLAAFKMKFDQFWNDTTPEPNSLVKNPPYFLNWDDACAKESACADYATSYPNPAPMVIDTARLEPDAPLPADMVWGQGPLFNNRLVQEINKETSRVDFAIYRLTVSNITEALLARHKNGVPVRIILEPNEYRNRKWPEFWLTHAYMDKLWAAGVQMKKRVHTGLTHMKMLVTSSVATNASSNLAAAWQRDHNYFVPASGKPQLYSAMRDRFDQMWADSSAFADFVPEPPDTPTLAAPLNAATGISPNTPLTWNRAPFAVSYDVYLGTTASNMGKVGSVAAVLNNNPPLTYSFTPQTALQPATTYFWKVVALTNASAVLPSAVAESERFSFTTSGTSGPPVAPGNPNPANGATGVSVAPQLTWSTAPAGTTFNVAFGTTNPPPQVATGLTTSSYQPGALAQSTTYYWRVTAVSNSGTTAGPVWSFTTGTGAAPAEVVLYAADVTTRVGGWTDVADPTAAGSLLMRHPDAGYANTTAALANPPHYFEAQFQAAAGTRYRVWVRMRAKDDSKWNDSVFVQFSDSVTSAGSPIYRIGSTSAITENQWTCSSCQTFGWGWSRHAYWLNDTGEVRFQNSGTHTIRVQTREDGVDIDQIVISPVTYVNNAPGPVSNDTTIVPKPGGEEPEPPAVPSSPSPAHGATTSTSLTLTWNASGATSYDVHFGSVNPPPLVAEDHATASFDVSGLGDAQTYYWRITARNAAGTTTGPVWSFTTEAGSSPTLPGVPASPSPANGATNTTTTPTLSWTSAGAETYDVRFGTVNPPPQVTSDQTAATYNPGTLSNSATYYWQIVAHNGEGSTTGPVWSFTTQAAAPPAASDIVIYASDVAAGALHGAWSVGNDATSPNGKRLQTTDTGFAAANAPLATPAHYVDITFDAPAGVPFKIWLRLKALANSKWNDAVWVQFSDARVNGSPVYAINSTSGLLVNLATDSNATSLNNWGWQNGAYWLNQATTVTFANSGTHTIRIQVREDGVMLDQIVLSPNTYVSTAPGGATNDSTIVPKP